MQLKHVLLGATALLVGSAGAAQAEIVTPTGWYLSLEAGANWVPDGKFLVTDITAGGEGELARASWNAGYAVAAAVGYEFNNHWRAEFEVAYRRNDVNSACKASGSECTSTASLWELSEMVNVLYDFRLGGNWSAALGAGIGGNLVVVQPKFSSAFNNNDVALDDYVFAGQLIAQVGYQFAERWQAYLDYRYVMMSNPSMANGSSGVEMEKSDHTLMLGIRFDLQSDHMAPPPERHEPPPPPEPRRPHQFIVFFGFNKSNLSAEAQRVVEEAAAAAKQYGSAEITVVGHTDTVGSNSYNMRLSLRRSGVVKAELVHEGIKSSMIQASGKGETELMVETGDGVKEPQNRRATIDLH